jgi:signal transduction histidine kinase
VNTQTGYSRVVDGHSANAGAAASSGWLRRQVLSWQLLRSAVFLLLSFPVGLAAFVFLTVAISLGVGLAIVWIGLPILVMTILTWRWAAGVERWRAGVLLGVDIPDPHRPWPEGSVWARLKSVVADPAVWRDLLYWVLLFPVGVAELVLVVVLVTVTVTLLGAPFSYHSVHIDMGSMHIQSLPEAVAIALLGVVMVPLSAVLVAGTAWLHGLGARVLLGPTRAGALAQRVDVLAESRSRMVDASLDERRRIERDLHDGAQQRLVALAMDLGMARERMDSDPEAARELVGEAHEEAKRALAEIRDLVRGIHPAVLTDRGLDAAVSALAGRSPVPVTVVCEVPDRPPEAIESTAYFVVSEGLTNVAKHSRATHAHVTVRRTGARLLVEVSDDGRGGADPQRGSGLRGLADRVAAVDGSLTLERTASGFTVLRAELPCVS